MSESNEPATNPAPEATNNDGSGAGPTSEANKIAERISGASKRAIDQHLAAGGIPKRGRGRPVEHGRYSKKQIPVAFVEPGSGAPLLEEIPPGDNPFELPPSQTPFDVESASALVDGVIEMLNDLAGQFMYSAALRYTGDLPTAENMKVGARMSDKVQALVKTGGVKTLEKYASDIHLGPETLLIIGGATWLGGNYLAIKHLKAKGQSLGRHN